MAAVLAMSTLWDLVTGNLWRTFALALLVLAGLQTVCILSTTAQLENTRQALKVAVDAGDLAGDMRAAAENTANAWQGVAQQLNDRLAALIESTRVQRERDAAAVAAARAAERDADATLALWMDRYAAAVREPACAAQMEALLCVTVD